jgi:hypothetical protein
MKFLYDLKPTKTQEPLIEMVATIIPYCRDMVEVEKALPPILRVSTRSEEDLFLCVAGLFHDEYEGAKKEIISAQLRELDVTHYIFAFEVWSIHTPVLKLTRPIDQDDRRKSCLVISGETENRDLFFGMFPIDENSGRKVKFDEPVILELSNGEQRMTTGLVRLMGH